jgi:ribonuclease P protein component
MAQLPADKKLHSLGKNERLCNFTLKNVLFRKGNLFHLFPFTVYWKTLEAPLEEIILQKSVTIFEGTPGKKDIQNPSFPYKKIPANARFNSPAKILCGVSSKVHKSAVVRNHLKRLMREAYRKNKAPFYSFLDQNNLLCMVGFIYTAKPAIPGNEIEEKIIVSLQKIERKITEQENI